MENVISEELAKKEVLKWMDFKNLKPRKREERKDEIETIVEAICDGDLILDKDCFFIQKYQIVAIWRKRCMGPSWPAEAAAPASGVRAWAAPTPARPSRASRTA